MCNQSLRKGLVLPEKKSEHKMGNNGKGGRMLNSTLISLRKVSKFVHTSLVKPAIGAIYYGYIPNPVQFPHQLHLM